MMDKPTRVLMEIQVLKRIQGNPRLRGVYYNGRPISSLSDNTLKAIIAGEI